MIEKNTKIDTIMTIGQIVDIGITAMRDVDVSVRDVHEYLNGMLQAFPEARQHPCTNDARKAYYKLLAGVLNTEFEHRGCDCEGERLFCYVDMAEFSRDHVLHLQMSAGSRDVHTCMDTTSLKAFIVYLGDVMDCLTLVNE